MVVYNNNYNATGGGSQAHRGNYVSKSQIGGAPPSMMGMMGVSAISMPASASSNPS